MVAKPNQSSFYIFEYFKYTEAGQYFCGQPYGINFDKHIVAILLGHGNDVCQSSFSDSSAERNLTDFATNYTYETTLKKYKFPGFIFMPNS